MHRHRRGLGLWLTIAALGLAAAGSAGSHDTPKPRTTPKGCLRLPLLGAKILSDRSMALISEQGDVAIVRLNWGCLDTKAPQLALEPATGSDFICKKRDIDTVINAALSARLPGTNTCVVTTFAYVGHLDATGNLVDDDGKPVTGSKGVSPAAVGPAAADPSR